MPKTRKKKSKRLPVRTKHLRKKLAAVERRKIRKKLNKMPHNLKRRTNKSLHEIPNLFPNKEKILLRLIQKREREKEIKNDEILQRKLKRQKEKERELQVSKEKEEKKKLKQQKLIEKEREEILKKKEEKKKQNKTAIDDLAKIILFSDIVFEVLDARDPMACRCPQIEKYVIENGKILVLLLNKIDLVPREIVQKWVDYFRKDFLTFEIKCDLTTQRQHFGFENLLEFVSKVGEVKRKNDKEEIAKFSFIGFPNTGKRTILNVLKRSRRLFKDPNSILIEFQGIIQPLKNNFLLRNKTVIVKMSKPKIPIGRILSRVDKRSAQEYFKIPSFENRQQFLLLLAQKQKMFQKGNADQNRAAKSLLIGFHKSSVRFYTVPPSELDQDETSKKNSKYYRQYLGKWLKKYGLYELLGKQSNEKFLKFRQLCEWVSALKLKSGKVAETSINSTQLEEYKKQFLEVQSKIEEEQEDEKKKEKEIEKEQKNKNEIEIEDPKNKKENLTKNGKKKRKRSKNKKKHKKRNRKI
ncbi:gtp-binding protein-related [Anaeramoeba flamelloides]|uniref:Gtp-binding protein-related n=1 Tax=Anaeramoeba flamelloides TaxID=1746091 RepID=A0AAV8A001_9EUKA|nr:gtp-binding protein-related [Anaeramoeba flamelloides]